MFILKPLNKSSCCDPLTIQTVDVLRQCVPALKGLLEGGQLMDIKQDPGEVADQEDHDDGQEDDGQAVLLPPEQADVLRVVAVDVLDVVEAGAPSEI